MTQDVTQNTDPHLKSTQCTAQDQEKGQEKEQEKGTLSKEEQKQDLGPAISLDDFVVAAYGLNPANLHYNWLGYLSELPPDAYEFSKRVRKQVKTTPDSLVGYTS